jgi:ABC-type branched-subunit amino acid transport system permease subunit
VWSWLPQEGLQDGVPFVLIMIAMTVLAGRLASRGTLTDAHLPSIGRPKRPWRTAGATLVAGCIALEVLSPLYRTAVISSTVTACICLSVVVLTGYVGQISLVQNAFAGFSAFMLSHIAQSLGIGFPFGLILAALCAVVIGIVIGLPAVRIRGVNLAVATLAAAAALDALVFNNAHFSGGFVGLNIGNPHLFGWNLGISGTGREYPRIIFGVLVIAITLLVAVMVARLRNASTGRMFIAVRCNERAAASVGVDVARTKLLAFGLSAFIAGIGGGLLAYQQGNINPASFTLWTSLTILAITYVGGVGRIAGALAAGALLANNGVVPTLLDKLFNFGQYQALIAGVALALTAVANPDGIAKEMGNGLSQLSGLVMQRVRPGSAPPPAAAAASEQPAREPAAVKQ